MATRRQGLSLLTALVVLIGTVLIIQLWLVSAALDALLGGARSVLVPAAIASAVLFAVNAGILWFAYTFDRSLRTR